MLHFDILMMSDHVTANMRPVMLVVAWHQQTDLQRDSCMLHAVPEFSQPSLVSPTSFNTILVPDCPDCTYCCPLLTYAHRHVKPPGPLAHLHVVNIPEMEHYCAIQASFFYVQNIAPDGPVAWMFKDNAELVMRWYDDRKAFLVSGHTLSCSVLISIRPWLPLHATLINRKHDRTAGRHQQVSSLSQQGCVALSYLLGSLSLHTSYAPYLVL